MNSREKILLLSGLGTGILLAVLVLGALNTAGNKHETSATPGAAVSPQTQGTPAPASGAIQLSADEVAAAGIQVSPVRRASLRADIDAFGRVEQPEAQLLSVSARVAGRIDALHAQYTGQQIRRGQAIAEIYSPEVAAALEEYRLALRSRNALSAASQDTREQADALVAASRRRLELWGVSRDQIERSTPATELRLTVYSPGAGTIVERKVTQGQYVSAGETLLTLADLSTVWVKADVYESQLPDIRAGQLVKITSDAIPNRVLTGRVDLIEPSANSQTRTVPVHVHIANPGLRLVPGMFVRASFVAPAGGDSLVVPRTAVVDTGMRSVVYVKSNEGAFEAREVQLGSPVGDLYPVVTGLREGENVVTNGAFLLDSQTRLAGGMSGLFGGSEIQKADTSQNSRTGAPTSARPRIALVLPNEPKGGTTADFAATLTDADGSPISDAEVTLTLLMPAMPAMNMPEMRNSVPLASRGNGKYSGRASIQTPGPWTVTVTAVRGGQTIATSQTRLSAN